jgi:flagellar biosynthetic protein FlhB
VSEVVFSAAMLVGVIALPAAACGVVCTLLQTQFYIGAAPIHFRPSRISPAAGFARLFSQRHLLDFLKSCGRLAILCFLLWAALSHSPQSALAVVNADLSRLLPIALAQVANFARPLMIALAAFAALDVFLVRFQHARSLRMSRQEIRDEHRQSDGDPMIKAKLRRLRDQRARRRMMGKVKTATVVVTNPTHYAVALAYDSAGAPKVVAKGVDFLATRIREEAETHQVPIVANPPLARSLYKLDLDQEIPVELYRAVAEVIAFVWKLKTRITPVGVRP